MTYIQIPLPDFDLSEQVKEQAKDFLNFYLSKSTLVRTAQGQISNEEDRVQYEIENALYKYHLNEYKLVFISEMLNYLFELKTHEEVIIKPISSFSSDITTKRNENYYKIISNYQLHLYNLIAKFGYNLDSNTFNQDEIIANNQNIDSFTSTVEKILISQELLYNELQELKNDINSLKSDYFLGKKRWYQRAAGIVVNFAGAKIGDDVWAEIFPKFKALLIHSPETAQKIITLIGEAYQ